MVGNKTLHTAIDTAQPDWYRVGGKPYPQGNHQHPGSTYTLTIRADTALRGAVARERAGFYAAEARLNNAMAEVREFFANQTPPGTAYTNSLALDTGSHQRTVEYQIAPVLGKNLAPPSLTLVGQPFAGLYTILSEYTITILRTDFEQKGLTKQVRNCLNVGVQLPLKRFLTDDNCP